MTECAAAMKIFDEAPEGELGDDLAGLHQVSNNAEKYFTERKTEMPETALADLQKSKLFAATFEDNAFMPSPSMNQLTTLLGADMEVKPCTVDAHPAFAFHSHIDATIAELDWHVHVDCARRSAV